MIKTAAEWNPKQAKLKDIIIKPDNFNEAINLCLEMHSLLHLSKVSGIDKVTYEDLLWKDLSEEAFHILLPSLKHTIAWNLWHISRIEDIASSILIADKKQILNIEWLKKLRISISDTGNAMTKNEIEKFSIDVCMKELQKYRIAVGKNTRTILKGLKPEDMKRKLRPEQLKRIIKEGGVLDDGNSKWLIDFWAKKTVAGIILMPLTRHQVVHLNSSFKIKEKYYSMH